MKTTRADKAQTTAVAPRYLIDILEEVRLEPIYGCKPLTPQTKCSDIHHGPIRRGRAVCCEVCSRSGMDHLRCFHRDPRTEPRPESSKKYRKGKLKGGV